MISYSLHLKTFKWEKDRGVRGARGEEREKGGGGRGERERERRKGRTVGEVVREWVVEKDE